MKLYFNGKNGKGKVAIVDPEDYDKMNACNWQVSPEGYVRRKANGKMVYAGRYLMDTPDDQVCMFINRDTLDLRKENLVNVSRSENRHHLVKRKNTKYLGVSWSSGEGRWQVQTQWHNKTIWIGYFDDPVAGAKEYDKVVRKLSKYSTTNFPEEDI